MGTRSIVAAETERGIQGVYVHWDGYPEGRLPVLNALIARDGIAKVVKTIVGTPNGWSSLSAEPYPSDDDMVKRGNGRFAIVDGYGVQYTTVDGQADVTHWTPANHDAESWAEYVYIIRTSGVIEWAATEWGNGNVDSLTWRTDVPAEV